MSNLILIVDDEIGIRELLSEILRDEGYEVQLAATASEARELRQRQRPDMVLLDIWMPLEDGVTLLREWASTGQLTMPVVMMSGHATVDMAVEATRMGAYGFLEKPIALPKLLSTVVRAMQAGKEVRQQTLSSHQLGRSAVMNELRQRLDQIASQAVPLFLMGEPGCGIELIARHLLKPNALWYAPEDMHWLEENPFQPLQDYQGGIIFIAELAHLKAAEQQGLMQLISKLSRYHLRLICGSIHPLGELIRNGHLAAAFLAQMGGVSLVVPALREHAEDIPEIALTFLNRMIETGEIPVRTLTSGALNLLRQQRWPGNLPMLASAVRTLALTASGFEITFEDAQRFITDYEGEPGEEPDTVDEIQRAGLIRDLVTLYEKPLREARDEFEKGYFEFHLRDARGNISRVAERVGLERTHLYRKLKQLGIHGVLYRNDSEKG
ncbi:sigma-54 dependent transcriptional regulator [Ferrovum sp.]|uniref:sigma-54-dependent transcriptional regulator n=1 Tax=Ferrovum sp. TaxID=2609467 RepID=UPI0026196057|nr:sigma-54 dependent transcriptional regulator [Ferrovum sp.]